MVDPTVDIPRQKTRPCILAGLTDGMGTPAKFPTKFRRRHYRSKAGCLACRQRRKKCDEKRPRCTGCWRNMLECTWPDAHQSGCTDSDHESGIMDSPTSTRLSGLAFHSEACSLTLQSSQLLQHYVTETAVVLVTGTPPINHFILCILPQAYADETLMHAILAVSGAHLSYGLEDSSCIQKSTRMHYVAVLRAVQDEITCGGGMEASRIQRLVPVLGFLCQYEVCPRCGISFHELM